MRKFQLIKIVLLAAVAASLSAASPAFGATAEVKYLTRSEAARLISATDFLKQKIGQLLSWSIGYDLSALNRANLVPTIKYIKATPLKVPPDNRTILDILVSVDDPSGLANIKGVRADLSSIGQLPNMAFVDNGLYGDTKANDGVYTLQTSVKMDVETGRKEVAVAVANNKGWLTLSKASLDVERNPQIMWAKATPSSVKADGRSKALLEVAVVNPGRIEDIKTVTVDLSDIGGAGASVMKNAGLEGDKKAGDNVFSVEVVVPPSVSAGEKKITVKVVNVIGGECEVEIVLNVGK